MNESTSLWNAKDFFFDELWNAKDLVYIFAVSSFFFLTAVAGFVAMCIPFFGGLLGFFGGLVFSCTSYYVSKFVCIYNILSFF